MATYETEIVAGDELKMADKVQGGTPTGMRSQCYNCRMAHVIRGVNLQEQIWCGAHGSPRIRIQFPIFDCNIFDDRRVPSLYQMEQIAWSVTSRNRGAVGFGGSAASEIHIEPPSESNKNQPSTPQVTGTT